jgi:hypothetical protein
MSLGVPLALAIFLLGAAVDALLVSLHHVAFKAALKTRIRAEVEEDLRCAFLRKRRLQDLGNGDLAWDPRAKSVAPDPRYWHNLFPGSRKESKTA